MSIRKCVKSCATRSAASASAGVPDGEPYGAATGLLRMLKHGKDVRGDKVRKLRAAVQAGTYENDLKLSVAAERLWDDLTG